MSEIELQVVCQSCGKEVSPYVTECPYCGTRLRKKAPKLERGEGGSLSPVAGRKRPSIPKLNLPRMDTAGRPLGSLVIALVPAILLILGTATGLDRVALGAVEVPDQAEPWRFLVAPLLYDDPGYLFAVGVGILLFGSALEARVGTVAVFLLLVACGSLSLLGAYAIEDQRGISTVLAGGSGTALGAVAAGWVVHRREAVRDREEFQWLPFAVAAAVLLLMPLVVASASVWVAPVGGAVGAVAALAIGGGGDG